MASRFLRLETFAKGLISDSAQSAASPIAVPVANLHPCIFE